MDMIVVKERGHHYPVTETNACIVFRRIVPRQIRGRGDLPHFRNAATG
ncbi:hypothetical protein [Roseovarius sp. MMSF_3281]|nr:hypothetical protein [Roseovarius sp. MMSF_3281]